MGAKNRERNWSEMSSQPSLRGAVLLRYQTNKICGLAFLLVGLCASIFVTSADDKLKPEEIVAKHLDSIGPAEARTSLQSMVARGTALAAVHLGGNGQAGGQILIASQGAMNMISMSFSVADYPAEATAFDGRKITTSYLRPNHRSPLAQFLYTYDQLLKEGLLGGTLSTSWSLLHLAEKNPKLEYGGLKKVGDRQAHALRYVPRKGSDLKITLFFDAENFRHIRTEYERVINDSAPQRIGGGPGATEREKRAQNARQKVVEEFSDFRVEKGLNLPHTYRIELSVESEYKPSLTDWTIKLTDFNFNQSLGAEQFAIRN